MCSLEPWDDVWRRNQFFVDALLRRNPQLRILFVEPPARRFVGAGLRPVRPSQLRSIAPDGRLRMLHPLLPLPRRAGPLADRALHRQVRSAVQALGFAHPVLWINDATYGPLIARTGWPSLYDITDDWLLAPSPQRELDRLRRLEDAIFEHADEIVVCSPGLADTRGRRRPVTLVANGVDVAHFRVPQPRPRDLPAAPVAVYVGTLHDARIDVELVRDLARSSPNLTVALVGPDHLSVNSRALLGAEPTVSLLGARPYRDIPAYLQHADVVIVPHRLTPFTDSLDPIKAYECLAVGRPAVATPVAGFRELAEVVTVAPRESFVDAVHAALAAGAGARLSSSVPTWDERAAVFQRLLERAARGGDTERVDPRSHDTVSK